MRFHPSGWTAVPDRTRCVGCGRCVTVGRSCPAEAISLDENADTVVRYEAIVAAMRTYALLTDEEKSEVSAAHARLLEAINLYNTKATEINNDHFEATELAFSAFAGTFMLLPALLWLLKKRFMF